jgi:hypothetical protein
LRPAGALGILGADLGFAGCTELLGFGGAITIGFPGVAGFPIFILLAIIIFLLV